ncbi:LysR family transcriptional regulator [Adlercreutzia equolifaciens]|uniref:LysR family transcriptional regulator n=1 Tax=Adlercreutzia equolifaciens TaxID=446660 RepID=UPI003AAD1285
MEIHQLEQFKAIAECATMREAAKRLYVSQPALSQNLKKLEAELDCTLFDRAHNQLTLTPCGRILLERAHRILFDLREVRDEIEAQKRLEAKTIRVGSFYWALTMYLMPQVAVNFNDCNFEVVSGGSDDLVRAVRDGALDIAFVADGSAVPGLEERCIFEEVLMLSIPPESPLSLRASLSSDDLRAVPLVIPRGLLGLSEWYESNIEEFGIDRSLVSARDAKRYLEEIDSASQAHFTTSLMGVFANLGSFRAVVPLEGSCTRRRLVALCRMGDEKVAEIMDYVSHENESLFGNHALLPFLLFPDAASNLIIRDN